jgi:alcohol dehydrogenase (cytochrome c)/quinohemoprotein ethanol dehydrogenase
VSLKRWSISALIVLAAGCGGEPPKPATPPAASVDEARLTAADTDSANWMSYGRTYDEQRFSPLKDINATSVAQLGLAWHYDLDAAHRAQESTPLVIDGVMYVTSAWSKVFALDARTGKEIWRFDPKVPGQWGVHACCDVVNRGVAAWKGRLYLGTLDGRLIALDAATGKPAWEVVTIDPTQPYTITAAPRVIKGKVIIGNGGAEMGVRGYVSAYDAETGKLVWRFYTVPGDPSKPFETAQLEKAAKTWHGEWWKHGGGGTVWDAVAYDPKLDYLYIGTGNGSPWNQSIRSPGGGDNLYLSSIMALKADTGEYVWHYQTTPGETWDFTATQHLILADLTIDGKPRQVIMQAAKNGFFYVLDRVSGELISANNFTTVNWATGIDMKTGRPIENPSARYGATGKLWYSLPGPGGAHNWQPMAYSPLTGLVYLPVTDIGFPYIPDTKYAPKNQAFNVGIDFAAGSLPEDQTALAQIKSSMKGHLAAWNPATQKEVWRAEFPLPWNGGVLATAGNLVFHGTGMGTFSAYQADTGAKLWSVETHTGILAPAMSYSIDGEQYVAVEIGWGGAFGLAAGELARDTHARANVPRVLAFKLNGKDTMPADEPMPARPLQTAPEVPKADAVAQGKTRYARSCGTCHGDSAVSGGVITDLRYSPALADAKVWQSIVHDGAFKDRGMAPFASDLSPEDIELIRGYVIYRAHQQAALEQQAQQE